MRQVGSRGLHLTQQPMLIASNICQKASGWGGWGTRLGTVWFDSLLQLLPLVWASILQMCADYTGVHKKTWSSMFSRQVEEGGMMHGLERPCSAMKQTYNIISQASHTTEAMRKYCVNTQQERIIHGEKEERVTSIHSGTNGCTINRHFGWRKCTVLSQKSIECDAPHDRKSSLRLRDTHARARRLTHTQCHGEKWKMNQLFF